jgi:hypothetical protein
MRSPKTSASQSGPAQERLDHVAFRARTSQVGIGAAVLNATVESGQRIWDCIVSDGEQWQYVRVVGVDLGPFAGISPVEIEEGIERFAATLPVGNRLYQLLNFNPLHIDAEGNVGD